LTGFGLAVTHATVGGWLRGRQPHPKTRHKLSEFFKLTEPELFDDEVSLPDFKDWLQQLERRRAQAAQRFPGDEEAAQRFLEQAVLEDIAGGWRGDLAARLRREANALREQAVALDERANSFDPHQRRRSGDEGTHAPSYPMPRPTPKERKKLARLEDAGKA